MPTKRELIEPHEGDKRYIRRDERGRIKESVDVGRSLSQDRRRKARTVAKPGQGDKGDRKAEKRPSHVPVETGRRSGPKVRHATKPKQAQPMSAEEISHSSKSTGDKARAIAQSSLGDKRRHFEPSARPAAPRENTGTEFKAEAERSEPQDQENNRPLEEKPASAQASGIEKIRAELLSKLQTRPTRVPSAFASTMKVNVEIHQFVTSRAAATVRFATNLARCRSPMEVWQAQLQFAKDLLRPSATQEARAYR